VSKKAKILITALIFYCFFITGQVSAANVAKPIYSMAVSGNVSLNKSDSYARIILTDTSGNEYLMYEAQGPFDSGSFSFENTCEETCVLNGITPKKVDVEAFGAMVHIDKLFMIEDKASMNAQVQTMGMQTYTEALDPVQEDIKIDKINQYIKANNLAWTAGKTSVSSYSYEQKKKLMGAPDKLPNLQGLEYYKGGVFETAGTNVSPKSVSASNLPRSFDWRNRHGKNWMTSIKNQNKPKPYSSCWAFATMGTIEATANLYFNQQLNLDLAEQELVSCFSRSSDGLLLTEKPALIEHISSIGTMPETCFPYTATNSQCRNRCQEWQKLTLKINAGITVENSENEIKKALITKGPIWAGGTLAIPRHAMVLSGYDTNPDSTPIWIFKNSWGTDWGEKGYLRSTALSGTLIQPEFIYFETSDNQSNYPILKINCVDKDNDGYCNWGISEAKPSSCLSLSCKPEKDCDDSNPNLGPFNFNYNCVATNLESLDEEPPYVGKVFAEQQTETYYTGKTYTFKAEIKDNKGVSGCEFFYRGHSFPMGGEAILDSPYCKHCYAQSKIHTSLIAGKYSLYAKCWDETGNITEGEALEIDIILSSGGESPVVGIIEPTSAVINVPTTLSVQVSDDTLVQWCLLYIDDLVGEEIELSDYRGCKSCTASKSHTFISEGVHSAYVKCWDDQNNGTEGPKTKITVTAKSILNGLSVGKIQPASASLNVSQRFSASVFDNSKVVSCGLKVNASIVKDMDLSKNPCIDCTAIADYAFTSKGNYSVLARCIDDEGNAAEGEPINISIGAQCPDCARNGTDLCKTPPKCEKDCGASQECDGKERFDGWSFDGNTCHFCGSGCDYNTDKTKPSDNILLGDLCYFDCNIDCGGSGWTTTYHPSICKTENCSKTKVTGNICYYLRSCGTSGCRYLNTDTNKLCNNSTCTESGWDNSTCQSPTHADNWKPCNPSPSWVCGESQGGSSPFCEGQHIGWGWGDEGEVICPEGTIVTEGLCKGKNDDSVKSQEIKINMVPSPAIFSNTTTFLPQSSWYCKFSCSKLFCGADGCAWANCEAGNQSIGKIELKIYNLSGSLVYNKTVSNQGSISWDGRNNAGEQLANGIYAYQTKVYLKNNKTYTTQDIIKIQR